MVHGGIASKAVGIHQDFIVFESGRLIDDLHAVLQGEHSCIEGIIVFSALDRAFHRQGGNQRLVADGLHIGFHFNFLGFVEQVDKFFLGGQLHAFFLGTGQRDDNVVLTDEFRNILVDGLNRQGRKDLAEQHILVLDAHQRLVGEEVGEDGVEVAGSLLLVALVILVFDTFHEVGFGTFKF